MSELRAYFDEKLREWCQTHGKSAEEELKGKVLEYSASIPVPGTVWELLEAQIRGQADAHAVSPEKFVDHLLSQENAEMVMLVLQV